MATAEWCILCVVILAYATVFPAKALGRREFDNANPRNQSFYTPGFRVRSLGAHQNGMEAIPFFAAAVVLAEMHGAAQRSLDWLAVGFTLSRVAYVGCYLADVPTVRSILWTVGFAFNLAIFLSPMLIGH